VYELDDVDISDFTLFELADTLKTIASQLERRVVAKIGNDGHLQVLGEVKVKPEANAVAVTPTEEGVRHWGLLMQGAKPGREVIIDQLVPALAALTNDEFGITEQDPLAALDQAPLDAGLWSAATEAELYVRRHDAVYLTADQILTGNRVPPALKRRTAGVHVQAVHRAWRTDEQRPDQLVPVITKAIPQDASSAQRAQEARSLALEYAGLTALARQGLPTARAELRLDADDEPLLVIDRFDRNPVPVEGWDSGRAVVRAVDLATGYEAISIDQFRARYGRVPGRDAFDAMQTVADSTPEVSEHWMTRRLFDALIGNTDHHGKNALMLRNEDGFILAPNFDVTPYLMAMPPAVAREDGMEGVVLGALSLEAIGEIDPSIKLWAKDNPDAARKAFQAAVKARSEMARILREELLPEGFVSKADVTAFENYLATPLASQVLKPENQPGHKLGSRKAPTPQ
jgi:hypothetical protein